MSQWLKIDLKCPQNIVSQFQSSTFGQRGLSAIAELLVILFELHNRC